MEAGAGAEVFVAGGAEIYALFIARANRLYLTEIDADVEGDELFPRIHPAEWSLVRTQAGEPGTLPHRFALYERRRGA